ncbi:MAG: hypothetical protein LIP77_00220, partial [Planctomycetes bacterium]|nr:hypothetical protein [Planctomycetota bacterium]
MRNRTAPRWVAAAAAALIAAMGFSAVPAADVSLAHNGTEISPWEGGAQAALRHLEEASGGAYTGRSYSNGVRFQSNWEI